MRVPGVGGTSFRAAAGEAAWVQRPDSHVGASPRDYGAGVGVWGRDPASPVLSSRKEVGAHMALLPGWSRAGVGGPSGWGPWPWETPTKG